MRLIRILFWVEHDFMYKTYIRYINLRDNNYINYFIDSMFRKEQSPFFIKFIKKNTHNYLFICKFKYEENHKRNLNTTYNMWYFLSFWIWFWVWAVSRDRLLYYKYGIWTCNFLPSSEAPEGRCRWRVLWTVSPVLPWSTYPRKSISDLSITPTCGTSL